MKANAMPFMGNNLTSLVLGGLAVLLVLATLSGKKIPWISNERTALAVLVVLGMAMCTRGIGRVAATGAWAHPLSILGILLGGLILVVAILALAGKSLPLVSNARQAILAVSVLSVIKLGLSAIHRLFM